MVRGILSEVQKLHQRPNHPQRSIITNCFPNIRLLHFAALFVLASLASQQMSRPSPGRQDELYLEDDDEALSALVCHITGFFFVDPVMAEDGRIYSRRAIEKWFASCEELGREATSPLTREEIGTELVASLDMRNAVQQHLEALRKRRTTLALEKVDEVSDTESNTHSTQRGIQRTSSLDPGRENEPASIQYLNKMFEKLDSVRDILMMLINCLRLPGAVIQMTNRCQGLNFLTSMRHHGP
jgi:hypothetical protein